MKAPRSVPYVSETLEHYLEASLSGADVSIKESVIRWDGWREAINIHALNVRIVHSSQKYLVSLPDISVKFKLFDLFLGKLYPKSLVAVQPTLRLKIPPRVGNDLTQPKPTDWNKINEHMSEIIYALFRPDSESFALQLLSIKQADLTLDDGEKDMLWRIDHISLKTEDKADGPRMEMDAEFYFADMKTVLNGQVLSHKNDILEARLNFTNFALGTFRELLPDHQLLRNNDLVASGTARSFFTIQGGLEAVSLNIPDATGQFYYPILFPHTLKPDQLSLQLHMTEKFSMIELENLALKFGDAKVQLAGRLIPNGNSFSVLGDAEVTNVPIDQLDHLWPLPLAKKARHWVVNHISEGIVPTASARFNIKPKYVIEKRFPKEAIDATVEIEGTKVDYFAAYPAITNVHGKAHFTGQSMKIDVTKGTMGKTKVKQATVTIPQFIKGNTRLKVEGEASGSAHDLTGFIPKGTGGYQTIDFNKLKGKADSELSLELPLKKGLTLEEMNISVTSELTDLALPNVYRHLNLSEGTFRASFDGQGIDFAGLGKVNNIPATIKVRRNINKDREFDRRLLVKTTITENDAKSVGFPRLYLTNDPFDFSIAITDTGEEQDILAKIDFTPASIRLPYLGWTKPKKQSAVVELELKLPDDGPVDVSIFRIKSDEVSATGSAKLSPDFKEIQWLDANQIRFGNNHFALVLKTTPSNLNVFLKGQQMDLSQFPIKEIFQSASSAESKRRSSQINLSMKHLLMKNNVNFSDTVVKINCDPKKCVDGSFIARLNGGKFVAASYKYEQDRPTILIESDDAGTALQGMGIFSNMQGGRLTLKSTQTADGKSHKGHLAIKDYHIVKAPVLAKVLTLTSFAGILNQLNGQGIQFQKLAIPFTMKDNQLSIANGKMHGSSLGLTIEGNIELEQRNLDLSGTIIPAYNVNKLLGNIPVVGELLLGGDDQGLIAANYKLKGPYEKPKVSVNPLSILTPGFLRGVFDIK